jgi:hypothetical protein
MINRDRTIEALKAEAEHAHDLTKQARTRLRVMKRACSRDHKAVILDIPAGSQMAEAVGT